MRKSHSIKLYCEEKQVNEIINKLKEKMKLYKYFEERISYRGRNLKKMKEIIDAEKKKMDKNVNYKKSKKFLQYEIMFQKRQIQLISDF